MRLMHAGFLLSHVYGVLTRRCGEKWVKWRKFFPSQSVLSCGVPLDVLAMGRKVKSPHNKFYCVEIFYVVARFSVLS